MDCAGCHIMMVVVPVLMVVMVIILMFAITIEDE